jgi:WD40 repeat protein
MEGYAGRSRLQRYSIPSWQTEWTFDFWPPFDRLAYSPDGEYVAGINPHVFELRFTISGGKNGWQQIHGRNHTRHLAFAPDSQTVIFGWDDEIFAMEVLSGNVKPCLYGRDSNFRDLAFTGSGRHLGSVDQQGLLKLWDPTTWTVARTYDWRMGALTCLAFTADGQAGVCGTANGHLILFDLDE